MSDAPAADANPPIVAETPEEAAWITKMHAGLDALGAIPEVGVVFDATNALVYAVEGNAVQAGISGGAAALDLVPGVGTAGKVAEFGIKGAAKLAAKDAAEQAAKHDAEHLAEQEAKHVAEQEVKQAEKDAGKEAGNAAKAEKGKDGAKVLRKSDPKHFGARGPTSGREFDPAQAGGAIRQLNTDGVQIAHDGIDTVEKHISRFGQDDANDFMVNRLRQIADGNLEPTQYDLNYYTHELTEYERYSNLGWEVGQPANPAEAYSLWNNTHTATLEDFGLKDGQLYHPDAPQ